MLEREVFGRLLPFDTVHKLGKKLRGACTHLLHFFDLLGKLVADDHLKK